MPLPHGDLIPLLQPRFELELALTLSLLDAHAHDARFGTLEIRPWIPLYNARTIFVPAEDKGETPELLAAYAPGASILNSCPHPRFEASTSSTTPAAGRKPC